MLSHGIKINEPAADLGIALTVASSFKNVAIEKSVVAIGEIGLTGEIRAVNSIEKRINEAEKLGFKTCIIPESSKKQLKYAGKIKIIGVKDIKEALNAVGLWLIWKNKKRFAAEH